MNSIVHGYGNGNRKGLITVHIEYSEYVQIHYQDDGCGLTEEARKRVFDPFYTTNRAGGGSGLGMNIVYNLVVHRLKGQIFVKKNKHQVFIFSFNFP
nr:HAMP domain-containing sensor histidine kinase [Ningiella sp. W23]